MLNLYLQDTESWASIGGGRGGRVLPTFPLERDTIRNVPTTFSVQKNKFMGI